VRTLAFFWATSIIAIALGFAVGSVMLPRAAVSPEKQAVLKGGRADPAAIQRAAQTLPNRRAVHRANVPPNPFKAAADGNLLPVIVLRRNFRDCNGDVAARTARAPYRDGDSATDALIRIVQWVLVIAPVGSLRWSRRRRRAMAGTSSGRCCGSSPR